LGQLEEWLTGPLFLKTPEPEWPQFKEDNQKRNVDLSETKGNLNLRRSRRTNRHLKSAQLLKKS
jgi:hypothetical protein